MYLSPVEDLEYVDSHLGFMVERFRDKIIFITGATGFIGKCVVETLVWLNRKYKLNLEIHSISRNPTIFFLQHPHFLDYEEFYLQEGDICDGPIAFFGRRLDFLIHAATDVVGPFKPNHIFSACIDGTANTLHLSKKYGCKDFLLLSSGAIYGQQPERVEGLKEAYIGGVDLKAAKSAYALGKQCSEWLLQQSANENLRIKIARCFAFVGPYLPLDKHFAIGNFLRDALLGKDIEILGDGSAIRTYLYTSDLVFWLLRILLDGKSREVWNVGGSEAVSIADLAVIIANEINPSLRINIHQAPSIYPPHRYVPDITKALKELGVKPGIALRQAISKTAMWNRQHVKK